MAFRTVIVKNRCKLEYSLNYLVCRGDEEKRILLDEIEFLIILPEPKYPSVSGFCLMHFF